MVMAVARIFRVSPARASARPLDLSPENPDVLDVDIDRKKTGVTESEADCFALEMLISPDIWNEQVLRRMTAGCLPGKRQQDDLKAFRVRVVKMSEVDGFGWRLN